MVPKIVSATYVSPLSVAITFSDGKEQTVNVGEFIRKHPHPQYNSYLKEPKFKKFKVENGLLVWGNNWDLIFPSEDLYHGHLSD